jgi:hypothetical protein
VQSVQERSVPAKAVSPLPLVDNAESLLDTTDLVFVDAVGTGTMASRCRIVLPDLAAALALNPNLRVLSLNGYLVEHGAQLE